MLPALLICVLLSSCIGRNVKLPKDQILLDAKSMSKDAVLERLRDRSAKIRTLTVVNSTITAARMLSRDEIRDYGKGPTAIPIEGRLFVERPTNQLHLQIQAAGIITGADIVSDDKQYKISLSSSNTFGVADVASPIQSNDFKCNLKPSHIMDALFVDGERFWNDKGVLVVMREATEVAPDGTHSFYLIDFVKVEGAIPLEELWFDRGKTTEVSKKIHYTPEGTVESEVRYSDYQTVNSVPFPQKIEITRPLDKYSLVLNIQKMALNEDTPPDAFTLERPAGADTLDFKTCKPVKLP
jgi:hypothetical protein